MRRGNVTPDPKGSFEQKMAYFALKPGFAEQIARETVDEQAAELGLTSEQVEPIRAQLEADAVEKMRERGRKGGWF